MLKFVASNIFPFVVSCHSEIEENRLRKIEINKQPKKIKYSDQLKTKFRKNEQTKTNKL